MGDHNTAPNFPHNLWKSDEAKATREQRRVYNACTGGEKGSQYYVYIQSKSAGISCPKRDTVMIRK